MALLDRYQLYWPPLIGIQRIHDFMKKRLLYCAALAICAQAIMPSVGLAQKGYAIGFGGGAAIPVGKLADVQNTGYNAIVTLAIGFSDLPIGMRFDGMYNDLSDTGSPPIGVTSTKLRVSALLANFVYAFPGTTKKAYVIAGGGLYKSKTDVSGAKSENDWGFNGGLGVTFGFGPFASFVESRYHSISRSESKGGVYQFVPITLGFMF